MIVVGNGNFTQPQGHMINLFDKVVRLSSFKIKGYENIVGTKTDIVSVARLEDMEAEPSIVWIGNPLGLSATPIELVKKHYKNYVINDNINTAYEYLDYNNQESHPTLGFITIVMAMRYSRFVYGEPPTITGFDFAHAGCRKYYWTEELRKEPPQLVHHNCTKERDVVKQLITKNMVKLLCSRDMILLEENITSKMCL